MKKTALLLLCGALFLGACQKIDYREEPSKDEELTGQLVDVSPFSGAARKLFVLNEGQMGSNNASLDFLRFPYGIYISDAFAKMNPSVGAGLGDVGNDIAVIGEELWMVVNNSGIVEVVSVFDETEVAAISVPTPRNIAFDDKYAYVTSWAGAFATGAYDEYGNYSITDSFNTKGQVYRINLKTKQVEGSVEVGYQPEGIEYYGGKLYVANSGGISSQLPPTYSYDSTVSIIDAASFKVSSTVDVQINLKDVYSDGAGNIYVTTLGNFWDVHSGLYTFNVSNPTSVSLISNYVSVSAIYGDTVYCIGTDTEFDWSASHEYSLWGAQNGKKTIGISLDLAGIAPYSFFVLDPNTFFIGDAGDYFNPGTLNCFHRGNKLWSIQAGVCPGHFATY